MHVCVHVYECVHVLIWPRGLGAGQGDNSARMTLVSDWLMKNRHQVQEAELGIGIGLVSYGLALHRSLIVPGLLFCVPAKQSASQQWETSF